MNQDKLPFIPYGQHTITNEDIDAVVHVLKNEHLTQGSRHQLFEHCLADFLKVNHVISTNSATSALHIACLALGLSSGDYCWTSPISFVASANCALYCGAEIDFVDIDPHTGLICLDALEDKLSHSLQINKLPKVVIPVHLAGTSCDMQRLKHLSDIYGFKIIEDASHAVGGSFGNSKVGSCQYSECSVFSFHPVKIITSGEGGCVTTNNPTLAKKMQSLRSHGITKDSAEFKYKSNDSWYYEQHTLGYNYRLTDLQAALGLSQLQRITAIIEERTTIYETYVNQLSDCPLTFLRIPNQSISSFHLAIIRLHDPSPSHHSNIFKALREAKIGVQLHYLPIHLQPYFRALGFQIGQYPHAEFYAKNALSLPIYPGLDMAKINYVVSTLTRLLS